MKDAVEADVAESARADDLGELVLPVRAQRFIRSSGADTLRPDVREHALVAQLTVDQQSGLEHRVARHGLTFFASVI
ncbi:hypothetical protein AAH979_41785 [Plantactinospora sp. ZYX-F-223]|uniref:hypothetical protein n=1 Tax=Plantactinospora sp. ZYX-F-223 TaxID=3144103 RepID=UPI0031FE2C29